MWEKLDRGHKLIAAILGIGAMGSGIVTGMLFIGHYAAASETKPIERRVTVLETQRDNEIEWRQYLAEQMGQIAVRVGAPAAPPPIRTVTKEPREDSSHE